MIIGLYFILTIIFILVAILMFRTSKLNFKKDVKYDCEMENLDVDDITLIFSQSLQYTTISQKDYFEVNKTHFHNFLNYLELTFPLVHSKLKKEIINNYSLFYTWEGKVKNKTILLMGHYDVVPVEGITEGEWIYNPFEGTVADGFIWGRGAIDDKAGVISTLYAVECLLKKGFEPDDTIYLAFGHDEEIGGREGAYQISQMLKEKNIKIDYVLDEGGAIVSGFNKFIKKPLATVGIAEKGYISIELTSESSGGHSSMPTKNSSIGMLSQAIVNLENKQCSPTLSRVTKLFLESLIPYISYSYKIVMSNLWLFWPLLSSYVSTPLIKAMIRTTTAVTMAEAGVKDNILPTIAKAIVNFRIIPGNTAEGVLNHSRKIVKNTGIKVEKYGQSWDPSKISGIDNEGYAILSKTINQLFPGVPVIPNLVLGATDSRHFLSVSDNIYRFRPLIISLEDMKRVHGINERIPIVDLVKMVQFYVLFIRNINRIK